MVPVALVRVAVFVRRLLPDAAARALAFGLADACWLVLRGRRRTIRENLARIAPSRTPAERRRLVRSTFRNLAACASDFLAFPSTPPERMLEMIDKSGLEHLDAALARGRGAIVITGHLGNFELAGLALAALGYRCHTVAESIAPGLDRLYTRFRSATGAVVAPLERGAAASLRALARREVLMLVADRAIRSASMPLRFAGGVRALPTGPAAIAISRGAPIMVAHVVLDPSGNGRRYLGVVGPEISTEGLTKDDVPRLAQELADRLSEIVTRYPDQWFVFQPDWLEDES
ncbi:MAG: lysophospholipid acyltransferase family protein [Vicinamibacterales bacterium]